MKAGLKKKILYLVLSIASIAPIVAGFIIYRNNLSSGEYQVVTDQSMPRAMIMGETLANFRQVRVQVRSLAIRGNTPEDIKTYLGRIEVALGNFLKSKESLEKMMENSPEEFAMAKKVDEHWGKFLAFGGEVLALAKKGDEASLNLMADKIRLICPELAKPVEDAILVLYDWQNKKALERVSSAKETAANTKFFSMIIVAIGLVTSLFFGFVFSNALVKSLAESVSKLTQSANEIQGKSNDVAGIASNLSEAATEQAASLQETVASIDEISAMIARNSDSAVASTKISENSNRAAQKGKDKVELMIDSINAISSGNNEIIDQMQKTNKEISEIVVVIKEISQKTQVINDIVFQTKLLSFNASVEAARAGEHGKGFAVVAEEVGNLASMSGKAATEITDMLSKSVKRVTDIVDGTKGLMDNMIRQSKEKVEIGTSTAMECAQALDEILTNVTSVNEMIREISTASQEQASGVQEVNKAMSQLDQVTQQNSVSAQNSSEAARDLNAQVDRLNTIVSELTAMVQGGNSSGHRSNQGEKLATVHKIDPFTREKVSRPLKKAAGAYVDTAPGKDDPRFEDV